MTKKLITSGVVVLVLALLVTLAPSCGKKEGEIKTLKIGFLGALSGPLAGWGVPWEQGVKWAADTINERGGLKVGHDTYVIEVVSYDNKGMGSESATGATKLAYDDGVKFSTAGILPGEVSAVQPIFHEAKVFATGAGGYSCFPDFPYYFDGATHYPTWCATYLELVKAYNPDLRDVALLMQNSPQGDIERDVTNALREGFGWTVVAEEFFEVMTTDFYPALTPILAKNPEGILIGGSPPGTAALIVKQARELGYEGLILGLATVAPTVIEVAGCAYAEGLQCNEPDYSSSLYPEGTRNLYQEYLRRYQPERDEMNFLVLLGYGSTMLYMQAVETAGTIEPEEVLKVFDDPNWRFNWFGAPGAKLGGAEAWGIRRQVENYIAWSVIENCEPVMKMLRLVEVP